jgi:hypothetical protein
MPIHEKCIREANASVVLSIFDANDLIRRYRSVVATNSREYIFVSTLFFVVSILVSTSTMAESTIPKPEPEPEPELEPEPDLGHSNSPKVGQDSQCIGLLV